MITEETSRINGKNEKIMYEKNSKNFVMITNQDKFIVKGNSELRRYVFYFVENYERLDKWKKSVYFKGVQFRKDIGKNGLIFGDKYD